MKLFINIMIFGILTSCGDTKQAPSKSIKSSEAKDIQSLPDEKDKIKILEGPIDVNQFKKLPWLTTTSGVVNNYDFEDSCFIDSNGFYGAYFLLDKENHTPPIGKLFIYNNEPNAVNWRYDTPNDKFVKLETSYERIKVWDSICVNKNRSVLEGLLENSFHYQKGSILHVSKDNYSCNFTIIKDTINKMEIWKTCKVKCTVH